MLPLLKYVINLPERPDRRTEMEAQLQQIGWRAQFLAATKPSSAAGFPSIGARGCFLSHLEALKQGATFNSHIVLMEDDLNFVPSFGELWRQACDALQSKEWTIFYPGHTLKGKTTGLSMLEPREGVLCTHFLIIHRDVVPTIIHALAAILSRAPGHPLGGPMHVDGAYSTIRAQNPHLTTYIFSPTLGYQRSSRSDVGNLKVYDRINILRPIVTRLRRFKTLLK